MIKYNLKCSNGHQFDSWFKSSSDFETLKSRGLLTCTECEDTAIEKSLMAPGVSTSKKKEHSTRDKALNKYIKNIKSELKNAKNVGWQFAKEARAMHNGEKDPAPIYGKAETSEAIDLIKEGINISPVPFDPESKEN